MIFTELVLENFGAYADRQVINLRPEDNGTMRPIILLGGMNGGGKTTLMDAIRLALYGQRAKCSTRGNLGYGDFLTQSVNSKIEPGKVTRIELSFELIVDDRWQEFKIIRAWDKYPKEGKDSLSIAREGGYDNELENTWDEYIENILPLGISNLFLFDGEQVKELAELETPPPTVVEAINSLLGLELAERLAVDLDVLVNRKRKALASKSQLATLAEIEAKIEAKNQEKLEVKEQIENLQKELKSAQQKRDRAYNKFKQEGGKIAAERSQLEDKINHLNINVDKQREDLRDLAAGSLPLSLITPLLETAEKQGKQEVKAEQFKQAQGILQDREEKLLAYLDKISLETQSIEKIKFFLDEENKVLEQSIQFEGKNCLGITEEELQALTNLRQNTLPHQQKLATEAIERLKQLEITRDRIEQQLQSAAPPEEYDKLDKAVQNAQQEVSQCKVKLETAEKKYNEIDREIDRAKQELKNYSENAIDHANNEHIIQSVAKVQKTLAVFREKLALKKLNKLESEVTGCFRYLLHKSNLVHRVAIDSGSFRLSLYDPHGKPLPKQRLSAGEKQLLAIAFLWGLARVSGKNLPIAIDTPLGRLDSSHRNNLVERYFPTASHQVILLSTDTEIGEGEVNLLREQEAIAREYLLKYDPGNGGTSLQEGYFW